MPDAVGLVKAIKKIAIGAVRAEKPVEICFGKVTAIKPLKISVEQKITLGEAQLVLSRNVTDFKVRISAGETLLNTQTDAEDKIEVTIYNGLAIDDKVILIRQYGGQKYIVWDRIAT